MNGLRGAGLALIGELTARAAAEPLATTILLCPPATLLSTAAQALVGSAIELGAQDCHPDREGAHTGDISAAMLADAGCRYVILGHSERRADHHEGNALIGRKLLAARAAGLAPILCVGETLAQREAGETLAIVNRQLEGAVPEEAGPLVVAYEPVWAIGTGRTPSTVEVAEAHASIRAWLAHRVADAAAVPILYGGSVKAGNARALMAVENVDGALVGGASLVAAEFWAIARACAGA